MFIRTLGLMSLQQLRVLLTLIRSMVTMLRLLGQPLEFKSLQAQAHSPSPLASIVFLLKDGEVEAVVLAAALAQPTMVTAVAAVGMAQAFIA